MFENTLLEASTAISIGSVTQAVVDERIFILKPHIQQWSCVRTTNGSRGTVAAEVRTPSHHTKTTIISWCTLAHDTNAGRRRPNILTCSVTGRAHGNVDDVQRSGMCNGATKPAAGPWRASFEHRVKRVVRVRRNEPTTETVRFLYAHHYVSGQFWKFHNRWPHDAATNEKRIPTRTKTHRTRHAARTTLAVVAGCRGLVLLTGRRRWKRSFVRGGRGNAIVGSCVSDGRFSRLEKLSLLFTRYFLLANTLWEFSPSSWFSSFFALFFPGPTATSFSHRSPIYGRSLLITLSSLLNISTHLERGGLMDV